MRLPACPRRPCTLPTAPCKYERAWNASPADNWQVRQGQCMFAAHKRVRPIPGSLVRGVARSGPSRAPLCMRHMLRRCGLGSVGYELSLLKPHTLAAP